MTLNKRYLRNFKHNLSFYISTSLLTALVVYMFIAISASYQVQADHVHEQIKRTDREDGQFTLYNGMNDEDISHFEKQYDVVIEKMKYRDSTVISDTKSDKDAVSVRVFSPGKKLNRYELSKGDDLADDNEILISEMFAETCGIKIGDSLTLSGIGGDMSFTVKGYAVRYDYFFCLKNPNDTFSVSSEFGVGIVSDKAFERLTGSRPSWYYSIRYNSANETEVRKALYDSFRTSDYLPAATNNRIQTPEDQLTELEFFAHIILPISIVFVVVLIVAVLGRKVRNEMKMIGILNALGYRRCELAVHYSLFGAIPGIVGGILGVLLGIFATEPIVGLMFEGKMESIPETYGTSVSDAITGIALPTLCYTLSVFLTALLSVKGNAIEMIKGSSTKRKRRGFRLVRLKASFRTKYRIRAVFGNLGRTLIVIFGLTVGGLLLSFCQACVDSLEVYVDKSVDELGTYEYEYFLNTVLMPDGMIPEQKELHEAVDKSGAAKILAASFTVSGSSENLTLMGMDDNPYLTLKDTNGSSIELKKGEYYLSSMGANVYEVEEGDELTLCDITSLKQYRIKVSGVFDCGSQNLLITTGNSAAQLLGGLPEGSYNCIMSDKPAELHDSAVLKQITKQGLKDQLEENILISMQRIMAVIYILGGLLFVMVIFLMVNILLSENRVTVSMLKVLGYHNSEINKIITHVYHIVVIIGSALGLLAGWWANGVNFKKSAAVYNCYVDNVLKPSSVLIYFGVALASYGIALFILGKKTDKVSMVESLKENRE
ncbi:MAG: ABC transporter permease [Ruminococcus sp.]|nr:ABC transporter permease [Ruminococcus sp.]